MDDSKRERIAALASLAHAKKLQYDRLSMTNTTGLSPEDAENLQIQYSIAMAEYLEAKAALDLEVMP